MSSEPDNRAAPDQAGADLPSEPKPRELFKLLQRWLTRYHPEKRYMRGSDD